MQGNEYELVKFNTDIVKVSTGDIYKSESFYAQVKPKYVDKINMTARVLQEDIPTEEGYIDMTYNYYSVGEYNVEGVNRYIIENKGEPVCLDFVSAYNQEYKSKSVYIFKNNQQYSRTIHTRSRYMYGHTGYWAFNIVDTIKGRDVDSDIPFLKTNMKLIDYGEKVKSEVVKMWFYRYDSSVNTATKQSMTLLVDMYKNGIKASLDDSVLSSLENSINDFTDNKVTSLNTSVNNGYNSLSNEIASSTSSINNSINSITESEYNLAKGKPLPFTGTRIKTNYLGDINTELYKTIDNKLVIVKWYNLPTSVGDLIIR